MTLLVDWRIKIGSPASKTDFSSRVMGLSLDQRLQWMAPASQVLTLTFDNHDGALTPDEIGGNGTYKTTNWFGQGVFVEVGVTNSVGVTTYYDVFHGLLDGFDLVDNGQSSVVTMTAVDWFTVVARAGLESASVVGSSETVGDMVDLFVDLMITDENLPEWGYPVAQVDVVIVSDNIADNTSGLKLNISFVNTAANVADVVANQIMSSAVSLLWAVVIRDIAGAIVSHDYLVVGNTLNRKSGGSYPAITFDLTAGTTAANKLDLTAVEYGFAVDNLLNQSEVSNGTNTATYRNTASINAYGASAFTASDTLNESLVSCRKQAETVAQRFGQVYYRPVRVSMSSANLRKSHDDSCDDFGNLLSLNGLWQRLNLTVTPTGGTSKTTNHMIFGRTINATPEETTVDLFLVGRNQFQSFILDTSELNKERIA